VREIDPDEQTRKKKFMQYYKGIDEEDSAQDARPSPFDLYSGKNLSAESTNFNSSSSPFENAEDAIVPAPAYTPPPDVYTDPTSDEDMDAVTEGALPQSDDFWGDFGLPDQPLSQTQFEETKQMAPEPGEKRGAPLSEHRKKVKEVEKKEEEVKVLKGKFETKEKAHTQLEKRKKEEISIMGPPGKALRAKEEKIKADRKALPPHEMTPEKRERKAAEEFEGPLWSTSSHEQRGHFPNAQKGANKPAQKTPAPMEELTTAPVKQERQDKASAVFKKQKEQEPNTDLSQPLIAAPPPAFQERGEGGQRHREKEEKIVEIESPSLPALPKDIQPLALNATTEAAPYLTPQTVSLFFQMVGTIFVMTNATPGINRTEIVLNNPSFANSKFFGATITIEKYATAPDSFNIRLSGTNEAVVTFKENIPSLLTAFENGPFKFRIGRIDVEYRVAEKPIFRRKEREEGQGDAGGDLGERR
jgi:hypothetical protein